MGEGGDERLMATQSRCDAKSTTTMAVRDSAVQCSSVQFNAVRCGVVRCWCGACVGACLACQTNKQQDAREESEAAQKERTDGE